MPEAGVGRIGDQAKLGHLARQCLRLRGRNTHQQQRAPGRGPQAAVAKALAEIGETRQSLGIDAAEGQTDTKESFVTAGNEADRTIAPWIDRPRERLSKRGPRR